MRRKDYELIAKAIRNVLYTKEPGTEGDKAVKQVIATIAFEINEVEPRFDPKRFMADCLKDCE